MQTKILKLSLLAALGLSLTACSGLVEAVNGGVTIDGAAVEANIEAGILEQQGINVMVECPSPFVAKPGESRNCLVTAEDGTTAMAKVSVENSEGDITWVIE
jgi:hypothetical protein